jgi:uncharacterized 2Fe-2S/4Fe-4S cluster protein (DUF4445 family)
VTYQIEFEPLGRRGPCAENGSLLDCARQLGIGLASVCGGQGKCKACKVRVLKGRVSEPGDVEIEYFSGEQLETGWRLACRAFPQSDITLFVPPESMTTLQRTQTECTEVFVDLDPAVKTYPFELSQATLIDLRSDATRLFESLKQKGVYCGKIDVDVLRRAPGQLRDWKWKGRVSLRENEIISLSPTSGSSLGLAVDLGTTKIAGYLVDVTTGITLASKGVMNPQIGYGEDITSRMLYAMKSTEGFQRLQNLVVSAIDQLALELCKQAQVEAYDILDMAIVGNTAMHHLLLGLPVAQLAYSPFVPAISESLDIKARDIGSHLNPGIYVHILPNIAGYVGADHVSMLLAIDAGSITRNTIAIDIGTNTEVSLIGKGRIIGASCASGPAFEGGHISHGMRAAGGAIERVRILNGETILQTIDNLPPSGICGSGVIDTLSQLYLADLIGENGRLKSDRPHIRKIGNQLEFVLVEESEGQPSVSFTQHDIRELQLAKAAIRSGIQILLESLSLTENDIEDVIIAGAFGTYIDVSSAINIGMLPSLPLDKFRQVGNAAGLGAKMALLSNRKRQQARELASRVEYVELATNSAFMQTFLQSTNLGTYQIRNRKRVK